jgi:hypothetical protein
MAKAEILGLYREPEQAAQAVDLLKQAGFTSNEFDILTGAPYPGGAFGETPPHHRLFVFPLVGAVCGLAVGFLFTVGTQLSHPLVTGGKPLLSIPPMAIVMYEGMMLGAIIFTVLGTIFESRLPRFRLGLYDRRISEGFIGVLVTCGPERLSSAHRALEQAGAVEVKREQGQVAAG